MGLNLMDYESFMTKFPIKLNEQQKEAVQAANGPVLLLAVPGSGKTTVLVTRLGFMISAGSGRTETADTRASARGKIAMAHRAATDGICVSGGMGKSPSSGRRRIL